MTINDKLLDAVAADVKNRRKLPCAILRIILTEQSTRRYNSLFVDRALILLAVYRKLLLALKDDLSGLNLSVTTMKRRWSKDRMDGWESISANQIAIKKISISKPLLFQKTNNFLRSLPLDFVQDLVKWAPPVVAIIKDSKQPINVFENQLSAFIASYVLADRVIKVKVLEQYPKPHFNLYDLLTLLEYFEPIYKKNAVRITIALKPTPKVAVLITDYELAWVHRIIQKSKAKVDV
jgi:hypothetical protein